MTVDLDFLHFIVTVVVLIILIVSSASRYHKRVRKFDEALSRPWGLVGFVDKEGRYNSRVPSEMDKEED